MLALQGLPVLAAVIIAILVIIWAIQIIKETLWIGVLVIGILAILFLGFGITPLTVWQALLEIPQQVGSVLHSFGLGK